MNIFDRPLLESEFSGLQNFCKANAKGEHEWDALCDNNNKVLQVISSNLYTDDNAKELIKIMNVALQDIGQQRAVEMLRSRIDHTKWRIVINDPSNVSKCLQAYLDKDKRPPPLTGT